MESPEQETEVLKKYIGNDRDRRMNISNTLFRPICDAMGRRGIYGMIDPKTSLLVK